MKRKLQMMDKELERTEDGLFEFGEYVFGLHLRVQRIDSGGRCGVHRGNHWKAFLEDWTIHSAVAIQGPPKRKARAAARALEEMVVGLARDWKGEK